MASLGLLSEASHPTDGLLRTLFIIRVSVGVCICAHAHVRVYTHMCVPWHKCGVQRATRGDQFSPPMVPRDPALVIRPGGKALSLAKASGWPLNFSFSLVLLWIFQ